MQVLIEGKSPQVWGTWSREEPEEDPHIRKRNQKKQAKNIKTSFTYFKIFPRAAVYGWLTFPYPASEFFSPAVAAAVSLQSCPTLCDPIDGSPLGSSIPGILQARTLEWVAISFSNACKWKVKVKSFSRAWLLATPWTAAYQAPPSMGFSRQEYWSGVPLPSPRSTNKSLLKMRKLRHRDDQ